MKRGKDEEKIVRPMFPRLHVNDAEKGWPRAPPRNKMALYEQLSIPSQRFRHGVLPPNTTNTISHPVPSASSSIDKAVGPCKQTYASLCFEPRDDPANVIDRWEAGDIVRPLLCTEPQCSTGVHSNGALRDHSVAMVMDKENKSTSKRDFLSEHNTVHGVRRVMDSYEDRSRRSLQKGNMDRVESIPAHNISPDDVVRVINQKHFLKARRAIVNQQRIFALQVFELHRLIKVQRLIAGLPHLLVEDTSYLCKPVKASPAKKLQFDYILKALPGVHKNKGDSEKPDHTVECSIENTVGKASLSPVQSDVPPSNGQPFSKNLPAPSISSNPNVGTWCFNPPHRRQWLIPVMSPSEGLVYKPYPGPEFVDPVYGPPGSTPVMGNFSTPAYGVPTPHHQYQLPSFTPAGPGSYFPPYGIPMVNPAFSGSSVEQRNPLATPGKLSAEETNFNAQHQNSFNIPSQTSESRPDVSRLRARKDGELQGSTVSSPSGSLQDSRAGSPVERQNACPLFSASRAIDITDSSPHPQPPELDIPDSSPQPPELEHPVRAIKVVPHNARSATESAARIFRIIQEEKKARFDIAGE